MGDYVLHKFYGFYNTREYHYYDLFQFFKHKYCYTNNSLTVIQKDDV